MKIPSVRLVFDRKHVATKTKRGLVQMEITLQMKRKWVSTGIKLYKDQWNDRKHVVNSSESIEQNEWLDSQVTDMEKWLRDNQPFSWEKLDMHLKEGMATDNFLEFLDTTIKERNDIKDSTKKTHRKLISILKEYGKMAFFSDLTPNAIMDFDNWLHGRKIRKLDREGNERMEKMKQQSIHDYHKVMHIYITIARRRGLIKDDPYFGLSFPRGESEANRYLSVEELLKFKDAPMRSGSVARARDLFTFQSYTGLSYSDLKEFDFTKADKSGKDYMYNGKREKTGETFCFLILPEAMRILKKYDYHLPVKTVENYNQQLKKAAADAGIGKPLSTHWARRTAGVMFINAGVRLEVVAKILGHSSVTTTEKYYTDITGDTVANEMIGAKL